MKTLSRGLSLLALVAWGSLMLYFYFSGRLNEYLIPMYRPLVALSGFLMLGIAGSLVLGLRQGARWQLAAGLFADDTPSDDLTMSSRTRAHDANARVWPFGRADLGGGRRVARRLQRQHHSQPRHQHRRLRPRGQTRLAGNAAVASANAVKNPAAVEPPLPGATPAPADNTPLDASQYLKTTSDGHVIAEVTDLLFASDDDSMRPAFEGKTVEMIGQFMPVKGATDGRFQIVRMFMVCCAADARPVAVASMPPTADAKLPGEMAWTKVVGKVTFPLENGRRIPLIQAEKVTACEPPSEAMLY